jgi:hypothetical protein
MRALRLCSTFKSEDTKVNDSFSLGSTSNPDPEESLNAFGDVEPDCLPDVLLSPESCCFLLVR